MSDWVKKKGKVCTKYAKKDADDTSYTKHLCKNPEYIRVHSKRKNSALSDLVCTCKHCSSFKKKISSNTKKIYRRLISKWRRKQKQSYLSLG